MVSHSRSYPFFLSYVMLPRSSMVAGSIGSTFWCVAHSLVLVSMGRTRGIGNGDGTDTSFHTHPLTHPVGCGFVASILIQKRNFIRLNYKQYILNQSIVIWKREWQARGGGRGNVLSLSTAREWERGWARQG